MSAKKHRDPSGRELARQVLRRIRLDSGYANLVLSAALRHAPHLRSEEKGLATELVYGVLRQQRLLDHALSLHLRAPLHRQDEETLEVLRLAAYQLLFLDRIPAHAAVNDAVEAVKRARGPIMGGLANAVLRKLRRGDLQRDLPADPVQRLAIEHSLPDNLARYWVAQLGRDEASALATRLQQRIQLTARVNSLKANREQAQAALQQEGARVERTRWSPWALQIVELADPFRARSFLDGLWTAQDEAAQLVALVLDPQPGETVIDLCSGVGGKAMHLAALMQNQGEVICIDHQGRKLELLREHGLRLGVTCCRPLLADLRHPLPGPLPRASRVLLDAPCSGLGVLGRHPELKWRFAGERILELVQLQREVLTTAVSCLSPGGGLVYSVCTVTEEEGPAQIRWLREQFPQLLPFPVTQEALMPLQEDGVLRLWPHRHQTDGFFIARLRWPG